ncbi:DUF1833 family protein [Budviciaceae bacterium CWB-B4]|uniref:DUF1833 family protein n=1 Tax=Limnobaculum xujianqingii TaxID=2738837 RepID=A0A9D7FVU8_9GAMM|nr:DUF1833 family protein [Limnobaculum xujianqingii]MBK5074595.1 DUF1833 family protein [Limnobaculum xujianqingii]MBK5177739.1 DUF1833 family protein [Limnobaculum xujianqingii]
MPTLREYRAQRPNRIIYETMQFYHPSFGNIFLVNYQVFPKTLGGTQYQPCSFELAESQQSGTPVIDSTVKFSRLAQDFKQQLKLWRSYSRADPIVAVYRLFDSKDVTTSIKSWQLYVKDCSLDAENVNVSLSMSNPLNANIGLLYDPAQWPGLEIG